MEPPTRRLSDKRSPRLLRRRLEVRLLLLAGGGRLLHGPVDLGDLRLERLYGLLVSGSAMKARGTHRKGLPRKP